MFYSVCIPAVFRGEKTEEVLAAVRAAGFCHYEFWSWEGQNTDACLDAQKQENLTIAAMCTKNPPLVDPSYREEYAEGLKQTATVCKKMGCKTVIATVGQELEGVSRKEQHESIVEGLKKCVPILVENDLTLVVEPLNTRIDHKGYYLWSSDEAFQIVDEVGSEHVKVLFDLYHQYIMDDLDIDKIVKNIDKIGHFHMAGFPGRHEPLIDSEIDYPTILKAIKESGYQKAVGLEYMPLQDATEGLKILRRQLDRIHE